MSKHTPGPWEVTPPDDEKTVFSIAAKHPTRPGCKFRLADVYEGFGENESGEVNARLIACAPEMLEALKELASKFDDMGYDEEVKTRVYELIASAEGRE